MPPGGPVDVTAPQILSITPDTGTTGAKLGQVVFKFDEVVAEHPPRTTALADLILISPRNGSPDVSWGRNEIRIKPTKGWRANTAYTVTLLPGLADLRGNVRNTAASTYFSTGTSMPRGRISGTAIDLASATPARDAVVEARQIGDTSLAWISITDSIGAYSMPHLPPAQYSLRGYQDQNHNFALDPGEPWDTTTVTLVNNGTAQLLLSARDSVAPSIDQIAPADSVTMLVTFDRLADSASAVNPARYTVKAADSTSLPVLSVRPPPRDTSEHIVPMLRPRPLRSVLLTVGRPLSIGVAYRVRATGVTDIQGKTVASEKVVTFSRLTPVPVRKPAPRGLPGGAVPIPPALRP
jgi:hypothetical protein